jgi:hypothetical protein
MFIAKNFITHHDIKDLFLFIEMYEIICVFMCFCVCVSWGFVLARLAVNFKKIYGNVSLAELLEETLHGNITRVLKRRQLHNRAKWILIMNTKTLEFSIFWPHFGVI